MLAGVNDQLQHATELIALTRDVPCKFNLIPFNPFPGTEFTVSPRARIVDFQRALQDAGLVATPVFRLPSAFFVNRAVGVTGLTGAQLADVYRGRITNWKDVGGADVRIRVVRREDQDSTLLVLRQSMPGWKDLAITEKSKTAVTTQEGFNTVKEVEGAIGFGPFTRALEAELVVLKIDGRYPTDRDYPSAVTLSFVHKSATVTTDAKRFIDYAKAAKAQTVLSGMGGVPVIE